MTKVSAGIAEHAIDEVLTEGVAAGSAPGVVALVADRSGLRYSGAFGRLSVDREEPMAVNSVVWLTSMTKLATSIAALQLVDSGWIGLDDDASLYVAELADIQVLDGFDADEKPVLRALKRPITVRHLLSHTAGFAYPTWNADLLRYHQLNGVPSFLSGSKADLHVPLACDPGDEWHYGISTDWLGLLVEAVSGSTLDEYLQTNVFAPLGMVDTGFVVRPEMRSRFADLHYRHPDGHFDVMPFEVGEAPEFYAGGSDLYSTGTDFIRVLQLLLGAGELDGVRLLQSQTVAEMGRNQIGDLVAGVLKSEEPALSNNYNLFPEMTKRWGLAGMIMPETAPTGRGAGSIGGGGMYNCFYWIDGLNGVAGLFLTQVLPFADQKVLDLFLAFETEVYASFKR